MMRLTAKLERRRNGVCINCQQVNELIRVGYCVSCDLAHRFKKPNRHLLLHSNCCPLWRRGSFLILSFVVMMVSRLRQCMCSYCKSITCFFVKFNVHRVILGNRMTGMKYRDWEMLLSGKPKEVLRTIL